MYTVRSLRPKGTMIEVFQNGNKLTLPINGLGAIKSDVVTEDMRTQKRFGFVMYSIEEVDAKLKLPYKPMVEELQEKVTEQDEESKDDESNEESEAPECYSAEEINKMKKYELVALLESHPELKIDADQNKSELRDALLGFNIPKE